MKQFLATALAITLLSTLALAQQWRWPDKPKNLTVLPPTTTGKDLQRAMQSFTTGLGVRCVYCHVGEEGKDLSEFDFPSDAKPEKAKARTMLRMVNAINGQYLAELPGHSSSSLEVSCVTCHRGTTVPITLEEKLKRTYLKQGLDSMMREYRTLREQFYGGFTYNFRERTLLRLADKILEDTTKFSDAIKVVNLNLEIYPTSALSYVHLASYYEYLGNTKTAVENYEQAIKLSPNDERLKKELGRLRGQKR